MQEFIESKGEVVEKEETEFSDSTTDASKGKLIQEAIAFFHPTSDKLSSLIRLFQRDSITSKEFLREAQRDFSERQEMESDEHANQFMRELDGVLGVTPLQGYRDNPNRTALTGSDWPHPDNSSEITVEGREALAELEVGFRKKQEARKTRDHNLFHPSTFPSLATAVKACRNVTEPEKQDEPETAKRYNQGKVRYDLVPFLAHQEFAKVLTMGAEKYGDQNWRKGMSWSSVLASLERHLYSFKSGEDTDPESGLNHMAHVICNAAFLIEYAKTYPQGDDRVKQ